MASTTPKEQQNPSQTDFVPLIDPLPDVADADTTAALLLAYPGTRDRHQLLANLGARMLDWEVPSATAKPTPTDERTAPAGYTYLGQFIAHDLSFAADRIPISKAGVPNAQVLDNMRETQLQLESIYGGGPREFPLGYVCPISPTVAGRRRTARTHLRLGAIHAVQPDMTLVKAGSDLPRLACPFLDSATAPVAGPGVIAQGATDVLIADPRNDDHALISQLTVLFCRLHNKIADSIVATAEAGAAGGDGAIDYYGLFERARKATTAIYRNVVWNDYLRRMLDQDIFERYAPRRNDIHRPVGFLTVPRPGRVAVEFSHAAFRFGHAMVRAKYRLGNIRHFELDAILELNSTEHPGLMPFDATWLADWFRFFDGNGTPPADFMYSRPLGPTVTPMGPDVVFLNDEAGGPPLLSLSVVKSGRTIPARGIATRDLVRSCSVPMASVDAVLATMAQDETMKAIIARHPLLADKRERTGRIARWLDAPGLFGVEKDVQFAEKDIKFLAANPPLFFFVLFEAEQVGHGIRLGPVGSFILAEMIFSKLAVPSPGGPPRGHSGHYADLLNLPPAVDQDLRRVFGANAPETMIDIVKSLAP
ncbi:peroxidase family protein [Phreatobacter stygius]|nr:peroxidase family protein [Phreatobacter stygius]